MTPTEMIQEIEKRENSISQTLSPIVELQLLYRVTKHLALHVQQLELEVQEVKRLMTFLALRTFVEHRNPVLYEWMTEVAREYLEGVIKEMQMRRAPEVIQAEVDLLREMKPKIRRWSAFNDDNWAVIDAQIAVLDDDLDEDEINRFYSGDAHVAAYEAYCWREGDDIEGSPSDGWKDLVK